MLRWKILRRGVADARKRPGDPAFKMPVREPDLALLASPRASLTWIGHATFAMRLGGKLILTDPVWDIRQYWKSPLALLRGELHDPMTHLRS